MVRRPPGRDDEPRSLHVVGKAEDSRIPDPGPVLWQQFVEAKTQQPFCQSWLALQCRLIADVRSGLVLLGTPDRGPFTPVAVWPNAKHDVNHLTSAAEQALTERRGLLAKSDPARDADRSTSGTHHVAYPVDISSRLHAPGRPRSGVSTQTRTAAGQRG